ncbi:MULTISPECIES: ABC transporter substrate-binding protein [Ureibacillus]|uniref:Iron complex transport system substrate-binding protein n=1 Tax=Ureibacillus thermosphaericus TaxID=51173 RepID=A0A840PZ48_URETH|nr:ABC transporter substrate-binding protein [Ureibacillus thermosphaericus]MBB5149961.1 iron complex transport system substrate-binding protein [Ureibacillus thermosphaericus]NKZ31771.1 ABC transporter substrate-binding protein [Ureibacillus thermosphaericus]
MKRIWFLTVLLIVILAGCGNNKENGTSQETDLHKSDYLYTVVDDRGVEIAFEQVPETVVSLQPSNTEILYELGVGDKVIGVTEYDKWPEEVQHVEKVSDITTVNVERVVELNPDVIFAYITGGEEQLEQLESIGLKVFVIKPANSIDDVYGDIQQIAQVMGVEEKGNELVEKIKEQFAVIKEKTASIEQKKKVYFEIAPAPDIWSIGSGTFQQELIEAAGVENIYADQQGWFSVSEEDIINRNPEAIITTVNFSDDPTGEIKSRKGWESVLAVLNNEVYVLNPDILDRPGPRIAEATEIIARAIYPELFED